MSRTDNDRMQSENKRLRGERDEARSEVSKLSLELQAKTNQIGELEKRMDQLKKTVQVQSEQIAGPREFNTPHRGRTGAHYHPPAYAQPPPTYTQPSATVNRREGSMSPQIGFMRSLSTRGTLTARRREPHVSFREPIEHARTAFQAGSVAQTAQGQNVYQSDQFVPIQRQISHGPKPKSRNGDLALTYRHGPAQATSNWRADGIDNQAQPEIAGDLGAVAVQENGSPEVTWSSEFSQFFRLTEDWARNYTNVPDKTADKDLPEGLLDAFSRHANKALVEPLLASGSTRYFLIAKLLNSFVTSDLFRPQTRRGFSEAYDNKITDLRHQIQPEIPSRLRHALMVAIADTAKEMHESAGFQEFIEEQSSEKIKDLWDRLTLLFAPGLEESQAWDDLEHIFHEAHRIGGLMMCTPLSYSFSYPTARTNSYFNPTCMLNRDVSFKGDPITLKRQGLRVRLGITPIVVVTNFLGSSIKPQTVHFANVLLMH